MFCHISTFINILCYVIETTVFGIAFKLSVKDGTIFTSHFDFCRENAFRLLYPKPKKSRHFSERYTNSFIGYHVSNSFF